MRELCCHSRVQLLSDTCVGSPEGSFQDQMPQWPFKRSFCSAQHLTGPSSLWVGEGEHPSDD